MIGQTKVPDSVFDLNNPGRYVEQFTTDRVGNVSGRDYQYFEKGQDGAIVWLTCDEYLNACVHSIFESDWDSTVTNAVNRATVHRYAREMLQGDTFPVPYLNHATRQQEGRHRACAVKEAFGPDARFPVLEVYPSHPSLEAIEDYTIRKCRDKPIGRQLMPEIAGKWYSQREIYDYLGWDYQEPEPEPEPASTSDNEWEDIPDEILLEEMAQEAGVSVEELDNLDAAQWARLVQKVLNKH